MSELVKLDLSDFGYSHISTSIDVTIDRLDLIRSGKLKPLFTSLEKETQQIGGLWPGELSATAGRTGCGKTAKVLSDMGDYVNEDLNPHYIDKLNILYDNWELPDWRNVLRFISRDTGRTVKDLLDRKKLEDQMKFDLLKQRAGVFRNKPIYFNPISCRVIDWYKRKREILQANVHTNRVFLIVIDHTRLVTKHNEVSEEALITNLLLHAMKLKNEFPYHCIFEFISQLNRNIEQGVTDRTMIGNRLPITSDIFGSDAVVQCADLIKALHRPGMYGLVNFQSTPTGRDENDPDKEDDLLIESILKQREGRLDNLLLRHDLSINKVEDYV